MLFVGFTELGDANSAAITLSRAFGPWPDDRLLQLCLRPASESPAVLDARGPMTRTMEGGAALLRSSAGRPRSSSGGHRPSRDLGGRAILRALRDLSPATLSRSLIAQVTDFAPEVIHSPVWGARVSRLCVEISCRLDIPVVPHFLDDWPSTAHAGAMMSGTVRNKVRRTLHDLLDRSPRILTVGSQMAEEYTRRYGRECDVVGNCVTSADIQCMREQEPVADRVLLYVGGLANQRSEVILKVAQHLPAGWRVRLFVNPKETQQAADLARRCSQIQHAGSLSPRAVPTELGSACALLFVEAADPATLSYTRLSVSGKVPEYLLSGRPVLAVGPPEQASIRELRKSSLTTVVNDPTGIADGLAEHLSRASSPADAEVLERRFSCHATQARLVESLRRAADVGVP
ncbi:MAG: hypothetical protein IPG68_04290 [Micrococcales bacterium]|nr:hypothetical protein [Micrococcales bacterium]